MQLADGRVAWANDAKNDLGVLCSGVLALAAWVCTRLSGQNHQKGQTSPTKRRATDANPKLPGPQRWHPSEVRLRVQTP